MDIELLAKLLADQATKNCLPELPRNMPAPRFPPFKGIPLSHNEIPVSWKKLCLPPAA